MATVELTTDNFEEVTGSGLVLVDFVMPHMNGRELAERLFSIRSDLTPASLFCRSRSPPTCSPARYASCSIRRRLLTKGQ